MRDSVRQIPYTHPSLVNAHPTSKRFTILGNYNYSAVRPTAPADNLPLLCATEDRMSALIQNVFMLNASKLTLQEVANFIEQLILILIFIILIKCLIAKT